MATTHKIHIERGRPQAPKKRGTDEYSSFHVRAREHSPFISPDRITRHASPGRYSMDRFSDLEVVPKISQPYRTSFSAVTSPARVHSRSSSRESKGSTSSPLNRGQLRSTMPVRMSTPEHFHHPRMVSPDRFGSKVCSVSRQTSTGSRSSSRSPARSNSHACSHLLESVSNEKTNGTVSVVVSEYDASESSENIHTSLTNGDATRTTEKTSSEDDLLLAVDDNNKKSSVVEGEVVIKKLIQKEYVHVADISFFKAIERKQMRNNTGSIDQLIRDVDKKQGESEPLSPMQNSPRSRSSTLPSEALTGKPIISSPVKKSLSTSITNFFKKMSPKSLRKFSRASDKGKYTESPHSSSNSLFDNDSVSGSSDLPSTPTHKAKSKTGMMSKFVSIGKKSKAEDSTQQYAGAVISNNREPKKIVLDGTSNGVLPSGKKSDTSLTSPQGLPNDSRRILRSIEDNSQASCDKSVYHAFKERQSPKRVAEAIGLKPQALKAVEFPDNLLQAGVSVKIDPKNESHKSSSIPGTLARNPKEAVHDPVVTLPKVRECATSANDPKQKVDPKCVANEPPMSLNVREVAILSKGTWQWPSASAESLGQCSLDIYSTTTGSEPSLTSRNGHRSSVTASKQTLQSQEENVSPINRKQSSAQNPADSCGHLQTTAALPLDSNAILLSTSPAHSSVEDNSLNTTSKPPSYVKLSCAVSGYNKYSSYGSPQETSRIRVIKTVNQNGSLTSVTSDQSIGSNCDQSKNESCTPASVQDGSCHNSVCQSLVNGGDEVDSAKLVCGRTEVLASDDSSKYVTKANVKLQPAVNGINGNSEFTLDLIESSRLKTNVLSSHNTPSPGKDGNYYLEVMRKEEAHIRELVKAAEDDVESQIPEEGKFEKRAYQQYITCRGSRGSRGNEAADDPFPTTPQDLAGFWDMVSLQVADIYSMFGELDKIRQDGWKVESPVRSAPTVKAGTRVKSPRSRETTSRSAKAQEAAKAREEARKRLMAAKKAGRQRKASQSDKEEIEIFVQ